MSNILISGSETGAGIITVTAPAVGSNATVTLPSVTTTVVGTDTPQTLTNKTIGEGSTWQGNKIPGTANGGTNNLAFFENDVSISTDYSITPGKNAMTAGPITINDGVTVTIPDGSTWSIV